MRIAFITEHDCKDPNLRSGVPFQIYSALIRQNHRVDILLVTDQRTVYDKLVSRIYHLYYNTLLRGRNGLYTAFCSVAMSKGYAKSVQDRNLDMYDCAVTISTASAAFVRVNCPLLLWIDNTFDSFSENPNVGRLSPISRREAQQIDLAVIRKSFRTFLASTWLKKRLEVAYPTLIEKLSVLPRGASIFSKPSIDEVRKFIGLRRRGALRLLFICSNWFGKGGDVVLNTFELLKRKLDCRLTIVGNITPLTADDLKMRGIEYLGYLRQTEKETMGFKEVLNESFMLIVPSRADGFGIVYAEAASYGLPSIAFALMGVTESVKNGVTGVLLDRNASDTYFAKEIERLWQDQIKYEALCISAYRYADENFDWNKNCKRLLASLN